MGGKWAAQSLRMQSGILWHWHWLLRTRSVLFGCECGHAFRIKMKIIFLNFCRFQYPVVCDVHASCDYNDTIGRSVCKCDRNYIGDGRICEYAPECYADVDCVVNEVCRNGSCGCRDGYEIDRSNLWVSTNSKQTNGAVNTFNTQIHCNINFISIFVSAVCFRAVSIHHHHRMTINANPKKNK